MLDFIKNKFSKTYRSAKIPTTSNVVKDAITLHGEDPGTIPPDDIPNPLTDEIKE